MAGNINRDGTDIAWLRHGDELAIKMVVDLSDWSYLDYEEEEFDMFSKKQKGIAMFLTKQQALALIKDLQKEFAVELKADG